MKNSIHNCKSTLPLISHLDLKGLNAPFNAPCESKNRSWVPVLFALVVLLVLAYELIPNTLPDFAHAMVGDQVQNSKILIAGLAVSLKTPLLMLHLLGLVLGIGGLVVGDVLIFRILKTDKVSKGEVDALNFVGRFVTTGLALLWLSGIGFLLFYAVFSQETLGNPKIWAKVLIVSVLTLNGFFIHRFILPQLQSNIGKALFSGQNSLADLLIVPGAVSVVCWGIAFVMGAAPALNFSVSGITIINVCVMLLAAGIIVAQLTMMSLRKA